MSLNAFEDAYTRLTGVVHRTPVFTSTTLNQMYDVSLYFKCENFQKMGAFKFRGAYNALSQLSPNARQKGVVTHSSGNHAQAVALAAKMLNIHATIVMPENAPLVKRKATEGYGADVVLCESTTVARIATCNALIEQHGYTLVHPYDNLHVIHGASTAVHELFDQVGDLDVVIAPVGGGGLLSGTSAYAKLSERAKFVYGAEPKNADDAYRSLQIGKPLPQNHPNTIADGLRTSLSELTFSFISQYVDAIITVSEDQILTAMQLIWERMKIVVEPSGAVPLAAVIAGREQGILSTNLKIGLILSGGNIDLSGFFKLLSNK